ncbi:DUF4129 domain-containing protein [Salinibacterium sp. ZJ454]|uniref:DUF4129 domain-containing protein n=1 Tax=Salinibacterium sp. ZJ454 TaxID=2708339 RepID=UPI001FB9D318|nr:DUF4129 domain-containing protein [Salinibacterium sp. ZJ454]
MPLPLDVPLDPDADEARDWILRELTDPAYQAARPNWFDMLAQSIWEWFTSLQFDGGDGPPFLAFAVFGAIVLVALVVAFLIFGLPRLNRRSRAAGLLFGDDDARTAAEQRSAAQSAAARSEWNLAIAEMFRAIARGLTERTIVTTSPGTTAHDFARCAGGTFGEHAAGLEAAATTFDGVRYLGKTGTAEQYQQVATLEQALRATRPALPTPPGAPPTAPPSPPSPTAPQPTAAPPAPTGALP